MATLFEKTSSGYKAILPTTLAERVVTDEEHLFVTQEEKDRWDEGGGSGGVPVYYDTLITGKETLTNQWRDGKPVYQMLVDCGQIPQGVTVGVPVYKDIKLSSLGIFNVDDIQITMASATGGGLVAPLNFIRTTAIGANNVVPIVYTVIIDYATANVALRIANTVGDAWNDRTVTVVLQYTKTTDVVIPPYQLPVPCWDIEEYGVEYRTMKLRNGKPVYKKLIDCGLVPQAVTDGVTAVKNIPHGIQDFQELVGLKAVGKMDNIISDAAVLVATSPINEPANYVARRLSVYIQENTNVITISNASVAYNLFSFSALLEYTKTIDTPETPGLMPAIVQETGNRTDVTMSQKAISDLVGTVPPGEIITCNIEDLQSTINSLSKLLIHNVLINVNPGTFDGAIGVDHFYGPGTLTINGSPSFAERVNYNIKNLMITRCDACITIQGFNVTAPTDVGIDITTCSSPWLYLTWIGIVEGMNTDTTNIGIRARFSSAKMLAQTIDIRNKYQAVLLRYSHFSVNTLQGTGNGTVYRVEAGAILQKTSHGTIAGSTVNSIIEGGLIVNPSGGTIGT